MDRKRIEFFYLNVGHLYAHFFMLIFATVAALTLTRDWGLSYGELIPYATPGFIAFGVCALPAGWLADKWSREGMMTVFFLGIGASSIVCALAATPLQMAAGLLAIGVFAAIYHPVGLTLVVHGRTNTGVPLAINGVWGNMGVAGAALVTGLLIDTTGWKSAFVLPGLLCVATGIAYAIFLRGGREAAAQAAAAPKKPAPPQAHFARDVLVRLFAIIFLTTAIGGLIFQSTTFALPKLFEERLSDLAATATMIGWYSFLVFGLAALAQLAVGFLIDKHSLRTVFVVVAAAQVVCLGLMSQLSGPLALAVSVGFMLAVFGQIPINDVLIGRISRSEWRARVYGVRYIVSFTVMASTVPLIAWIHARWGFDVLFHVLAAAAAVTFAAVILLPRTGAVLAQRPAASAAE